jgi:hypothetical protein
MSNILKNDLKSVVDKISNGLKYVDAFKKSDANL